MYRWRRRHRRGYGNGFMAGLQKRIARPDIGKLVKAHVHGMQDICTFIRTYACVCDCMSAVAYITSKGESINP